MPVSKSPLIVSSVALLAALTMPAGKSLARDGRHADWATQNAPVIGEDSADDIIYVMEPLKPVKGARLAAKKPPAAAKRFRAARARRGQRGAGCAAGGLRSEATGRRR